MNKEEIKQLLISVGPEGCEYIIGEEIEGDS